MDNSLGEHLFDTMGDTPRCSDAAPNGIGCAPRGDTPSTRDGHARGYAVRSAPFFGHVKRGAHHSPHVLGVDPRLQRLIYCAAT